MSDVGYRWYGSQCRCPPTHADRNCKSLVLTHAETTAGTIHTCTVNRLADRNKEEYCGLLYTVNTFLKIKITTMFVQLGFEGNIMKCEYVKY
jgi:hypothetical protein